MRSRLREGAFRIKPKRVNICIVKKCLTNVVVLCGLVSSAIAGEMEISPGLSDWQELKYDGSTPNRWREDAGSLVISGQNSVSVLYRSANISPVETPILRWKWRVDQGPPKTNIFRKGNDDKAISLIVAFAYDSPNATIKESMKRIFVEAVAGKDAPGRLVDLAWGGDSHSGAVAESPYYGYSGRIVAMHPEGGEGWVEEAIDIAELYRQQWGTAPPRITHIAVSSDSDDTGKPVDARITNIRFTAK